MLKQIIKKCISLGLIMIMLFSLGCSQIEKIIQVKDGETFETDTDISLPVPTILETSRESDYSFSITWLINAKEGITLDQFCIQYMKPNDPNWYLVQAYPPTSSTTYSSDPDFFDSGFGDYKFRMQAIDIMGKKSAFSDISITNYNGYLDFHTKWSSFSPQGGSGIEYFKHPLALVINANNYIFVTDTYNHRILQFSENGTTSQPYGSKIEIPALETDVRKTEYKNGFCSPRGIAIGKNANLYISDSENGRIVSFTPGNTTTFENSFDSWGQTELTAANPGISFTNAFYPLACAMEQNFFYLFDGNNSRILKIEFDSNIGNTIVFVTEIASSKFSYVKGIVIGINQVYVTNDDGEVWSINKTTLAISDQALITGLDKPTGIALDESEDPDILYVANTYSNEIKVYNASTGELILQNNEPVGWGIEGEDNGEFNLPAGLRFKDDKLFVTELGDEITNEGGRIQVFTK